MLRKLVRTLLGLGAAATVFLLTLEVLLGVASDLLPPRLGNYAFSKYGTFPGGMYYFDPASRINFLRRDFATKTYFNGYRWHHETDAWGFRNPSDLGERDLLILGDSLLYGHGVEETETLVHYLRSRHERAAYNMARQGDCLYQSYVLLRLHLDVFRPRAVVLFVFLNDFGDLWYYRTPQEITQRPELDWDYAAMAGRLDELHDDVSLHPLHLLMGLKAVRLLRGAWREMAPRGSSLSLISTAEAATDEEPKLPYLEALVDPALFEPAADYHRAVLENLDRRVTAAGATLWVVHLDLGPRLGQRDERALQRLDDFLASTCEELGLRCASTRPVFEDCPGCTLPDDGHLSPTGHRRLAEFVDGMLEEPSDSSP